MKQFIVLSAMIILGIFIAGLVFNLRDNAESLNSSMVTAIDGIQAQVDGGSGTSGGEENNE
jgi:hypothetical protein